MTTYQISIVVSGQDKASGPLGSVGKSLSAISKIAGGILAAGLLTSIARGLLDIGKQALESYANFERLGMALQSLVARELVNTGQAKDMAGAMNMAAGISKELLGWVTKLAVQSPFTQQGIASAFQQALAYGFTTKEAQRLTQAMVDYAAGSGKGADVMDRISLALGQIRARGKLAGQEINQLTEAGIPVREILAKGLGVTTAKLEDMISSGLVPADKAIQIITESLEKDFGGAAKRQATTFSGLVSSLEDIKSIGLRTFFEGTFKAIQPYVAAFVDKFSDPKFMASIGKLGEGLGQFVGVALAGFQRLQPLFNTFTGFLKYISKWGTSGIGPGLQMYFKIPPGIAKSIQKTFESIFNVISNPSILASVKKVFGAIGTFLTDLGAKVLPVALQMFETLGAWFTENGPLINATIAKTADNFTNYFLPALMVVWNVAAPLLKGILDLILGLARLTMQVFTGDWSNAWKTFVSIITGAGTAIWAAIIALLDGIANLMGSSLAEIGAVWSNNWNMFKNIVSTVWGMITSAISSKAAEIRSKVSTMVQGAVLAITQKVSSFASAGKQLVKGLENGILSAWNSLMAKFQGLINALPAAVKKALNIASPSKVFFWLGRMMMTGMSKGIDFAGKLPLKSIGKVISGFTGAQGVAGGNYSRSTTDSSQKYFAPVTIIQQLVAPNGGMQPVRVRV